MCSFFLVRLGSKHNVRASILASSLCLDSSSLRLGGNGSLAGSVAGGSIKGVIINTSSNSINNNGNESAKVQNNNNADKGLHSSSGVSSGSSDTASNEDKTETQRNGKTKLQRGGSKKEGSKCNHNSSLVVLYQTRKEFSIISEMYFQVSSSSPEPIYAGLIDPARDVSVLRREAELADLQSEVAALRRELLTARRTAFAAQDAETALKRQLADEKKRAVTLERALSSSKGGDSMVRSAADAGALVRRYGELYSQLRLETLDALDAMPELINSDELKNKLLFSVVVVSMSAVALRSSCQATSFSFLSSLQLAFRSVTSSVEAKRDQIRRILQLPPLKEPSSNEDNDDDSAEEEMAVADLEEAVGTYLRKATEKFDLTKNVDVSST